MASEYDPRYLRGIEYFNECEFFEAHEVWEDLWSDTDGTDRRFYQGLIQLAVCLHHFGNGNIRGARKLYHGCRGYLEDYLPTFTGLNVAKLLEELQGCCAEMLASQEEFPRIDLVPELIPEIHLDPPPL
jgi:predicted metal-dependent hydrolase